VLDIHTDKLLICGSRSIDFINLDNYLRPDCCNALIAGGARGIDTIAEKWAKRHNIKTEIYKAEWDKYGKSAGMKRNKIMVDKADFVLAFWDGKSHGTLNSIEYAKQKNIPTIIIKILFDNI